ncbi:MAG: PepSY-associated TM helix domain-containing protein [Pseudonocardiaceae bacterium]
MSTITTPLEPPADATGDREDGLRSRSLYRAVWRWHFYAGLFAIPVIVLLCLSGIVYLFKPQVYGLMYGNLQTVTPAERTVSYQQQGDVVERAYPGATVTAILTPSEPTRSTQFDLTSAEGKDLSVFVNPYSGEVLGHRDNAKDIVKISKALHGSLMTASWLGDEMYGDRFIEIVAGWSIVLVVTGIYLWWPRGQRRGLRGVLLPRFHLRGKRTLWRDVHAVTGILFAFVTMFFLVTGMAWTGWWGPKFLTAASDRFEVGTHGVYDGVASKTVGELLPNGQSPWALGNLPLAASDTSHRGHTGHSAGGELRWDPRDGAPLDAVVASAQQLGVPHGFTITPPQDATGSYMIAYWEDGDMEANRSATDMQVAHIDQYTAAPLADYDFSDLGPAAQATNFSIALHEGRQWGLVNQLMALTGALAILLSVASATVMWRKRRPKGLSPPRKQPNRKLGFGVLVIIIGLGALFPLLGLSMLIILALDFLVIQRVPRLARIFGIDAVDRSRSAGQA